MVLNSILQVEKPLHYIPALCLCASGSVCRQCVVCSLFAKQRLQTHPGPPLFTLLVNTAGWVLFHAVKWGVKVND